MRGQSAALSFAFMTLEVRGEGGAHDKPSAHRRGHLHPTGSDPPRRPIRARERHVSKVFVLDTQKRPLEPVHPGHARLLLKEGKAAIFRRYPFTIIRKAAAPAAPPEPLRVKIDPGSKTTGLALVNDQTGEVVWAGEITHRGGAIRHALLARRARRRSRRTRKTRHRAPRFLNRRRPEGGYHRRWRAA